MFFVNAGFDNQLPIDKILGIADVPGYAQPAPLRRMIQNAQDSGMYFDFTKGRRTRSVAFLAGGFLAGTSLSAEALRDRIHKVAATAIREF